MAKLLPISPASVPPEMAPMTATPVRAADYAAGGVYGPRAYDDCDRCDLGWRHRRVIERVEREFFAQAMALAEGNLTRAAAWLGITRLTLREKLAAFGLRPER